MTVVIPDQAEAVLTAGGKQVKLTNLRKPFWASPLITKRDLLQYYADVSDYLVPHLVDRAMVMKRYPNGAAGDFFYMKRTPSPHPEWLETCSIEHDSGNVIAFPMVQDLAALLWVINLGCIDLNPWYSRCDDTDRPDFLHFDLDPGPGAPFDRVRETALRLRDLLEPLAMPMYAKTTGSRGFHIYIPIKRGPTQKEVWTFAKAIAQQMEERYPKIATAEYRKVKRPEGTINVDYNQNAWGRTLASIYSVRPTASVSMPVTWEEIEAGMEISDFTIFNARERLAETGDLWKPVVGKKRFDLFSIFTPPKKKSRSRSTAPAKEN